MWTPLSDLSRSDWEELVYSSAAIQMFASKLFWPDIREVDGHVYIVPPWSANDLDGFDAYIHYQKKVANWELADPDERRRIAENAGMVDLGAVTWVRLYNDDESEENLDYLAEVLAKTWACRLKEEFPMRRFMVEWERMDENAGPYIWVRESIDG